MTPKVCSCEAIPTSTAKKTSVCHAPVSVTRFFQLRTLVTRRTATPANATDVALMPVWEPVHHSTSNATNVAAVIFSGREVAPVLASRSRACCGASGVLVTVGG
jgi:hypothetical protein